MESSRGFEEREIQPLGEEDLSEDKFVDNFEGGSPMTSPMW